MIDIITKFGENGIMGLLVALLLFVVYNLYQKQEDNYKRLQEELDTLRNEFKAYIKEDRERMLESIDKASDAYSKLHDLIKDKI